MRRPFSIVVLVAFAALLRGDFSASEWKLRRAISGDASGLASIKLDRAVYIGTGANLADLRVIRDGRELPYVLETVMETATFERRDGKVHDRAVRNNDVELVYDLGKVTSHNRLHIDTERQNFRQRVRIETSDDASRWATVREDGAIFDFSQDGRQLSSLDIDYPDSTRRYVRLTIFGWTQPKDVRGVSVVQFERKAGARELFAQATPAIENKDKTTLATFDLGATGLPVDRVEFDIAEKAFDRFADVETSSDRQSWMRANGASLVRYQGGESLAIQTSESHSRYWRVRIYNGDDQPLTVRGARFLGLERYLKFEAGGAGAMLYYGNSAASSPSYDLAKRLANDPARQTATAVLGPEEANPAYRPPPVPEKPWSERQPGLIYAVLGIAIAVLGFFTWRLLKSMQGSV